MTIQNYLVIENNVVTNAILWDGNPQTWTPPIDATMLIQTTTNAITWVAVIDPITQKPIDWNLEEVLGAGNIGFTWDGTILTTNQPKPTVGA
jgi:hypothetical protein